MKYNPWKTSTFVLLLVMALFYSVSSDWRWHSVSLMAGGKFILLMAMILFVVQLPDLIRLGLEKWRGGGGRQ